MKRITVMIKIAFTCLFSLLVFMGITQAVPECIRKLESGNQFNKKKLISPVRLTDGRTVFKLSSTFPRACMDCPNGVQYYDSSCKAVAGFTRGRVLSKWVDAGYLPGDFPENNWPGKTIVRGTATPVPLCLAEAISQPDSLVAAGVISIQEFLLAGKTVYQFEKKRKTAPCPDCASTVIFADQYCQETARFQVGGFAGILAPAGYTKKDFLDRKLIRTIWKQAVQNPATRWTITQETHRYLAEKIENQEYLKVVKGDSLLLSQRDGLYHFRKGTLLNRYKIIPQTIREKMLAGSEQSRRVYLVDALNVLMDIEWQEGQTNLRFLPFKNEGRNIISINEADWVIAAKLLTLSKK